MNEIRKQSFHYDVELIEIERIVCGKMKRAEVVNPNKVSMLNFIIIEKYLFTNSILFVSHVKV